MPFGGELDGNNCWLRLAALIPWDEPEAAYAARFTSGTGAWANSEPRQAASTRDSARQRRARRGIRPQSAAGQAGAANKSKTKLAAKNAEPAQRRDGRDNRPGQDEIRIGPDAAPRARLRMDLDESVCLPGMNLTTALQRAG